MVVQQRRIFAPRLSFKITLPYVTLAMILALATIYIVARSQASKVTSEFSRQVADARVRVGDSVVQIEREQVDNARTLARLAGLPQALRSRDTQKLAALIAPFAISQRIERIVLVGTDGRPVLGIASQGSELVPLTVDPAIASHASVAAVLGKLSDTKGDKFVELIAGQDGAVLYTVAPVYADDQLAGALLVGSSAHTLVERWRGATLADVTFYDAAGLPLATSLGAELPEPLDDTARQGQPQYRTIMLGSRDYGEVVGPLLLRGDLQPQFIGVAISTAGQDSMFEDAQLSLLPIFGLGLIATFLLGLLLSHRITRPITALVQAAEGVAAGNLEHQLPVTTSDEIGALTTSFNTMIDGLRERERMHDVFGRFVSPTVARLVLSQPLDLRGESKELTILFTDLRDFTTMAEQEDPAAVIQGLNDYFQIVVDAADQFGGIVNKFGGDSTLVLFGLADLQSPQASAEAAVRAALAIRDGLRDLNARRRAERLLPLVAGIGINTGMVTAGLIGTTRRMEYTAIGDAVNLSARIQTLNRKLQTDILLSQATYAALGKPAWLCVSDQGLRRFKGKSVRVRVYSINSEAGQAADQAATLDMPQPEVWIVERMRALGEVRDAA
ncbi:MAG: HAMP domain-containing protein [Kouleothrix sp.]|jgi:class 3 adenylate cyclase|nr:HAMP domain-containing protein [Kouleothrix sp.]